MMDRMASGALVASALSLAVALPSMGCVGGGDPSPADSSTSVYGCQCPHGPGCVDAGSQRDAAPSDASVHDASPPDARDSGVGTGGDAADAEGGTGCIQRSSTVAPALATQAAWDAKWDAQYGSTLPNLSGSGETFAWSGFYDVRAYVSMARTYGDTKYLDRAVTTINYWLSHTDGGPLGQGWSYALGEAQMFLDTGVIAQAIMTFAYEVWKDSRFAAYRPDADGYVAKLEPMLHTYDAQWVDGAPYPGSPGFYVYDTCGPGGSAGLCSPASLVMYNQGATMSKALLLVDRVDRLKGVTPDPGYLHKASAAAAYFKTFVTNNGNAYAWSYGGARSSGNEVEDIHHGDLDLSLVSWAEHYGLGGLTSADMTLLAGTGKKVLAGTGGPSEHVDGTGVATSYYAAYVGYGWIDLTDFDPTLSLFDAIVTFFNTYAVSSNADGYYLGWAEILRKRNCVELY